ncbi:type II secretion system protein [bacterium]|nr:type II secretion system protein [bacterium]
MTNKHAIHKQFTTHNSLLTKSAFTLAETLIVMGIIGVVAALTLPNLNSSTGDKEKVTKVKKIYSNLNDAYGRAEVIYGPIDTWFANITNKDVASEKLGERVVDFMKTSKICGMRQNQGCFFASNAVYLDGSKDINFDEHIGYYKILTADGTSISFRIYKMDCMEDIALPNASAPLNRCGTIYVDIDGPNKGQNCHGRDIFGFALTDRGIYPYGSQEQLDYSKLKSNCFKKGLWCTDWVIENGNMDYLKVGSDGKCPDGKTILDWSANTSCK